MKSFEEIEQRIFTIQGGEDFMVAALALFRLQAEHNPVYRKYLSLLGVDPVRVREVKEIPFLPVSFFKKQKVRVMEGPYEAVFTSSATTGAEPSKHYVPRLALYERSFLQSFNLFYGDPVDYCILALLPSYLEREGSSLVWMMERLIRRSGHPASGFYLHDHEKLFATLQHLAAAGQKTLLFGVSFALLDFAEEYVLPEMDLLVMETGGMKGRRREPVREELHAFLTERFRVQTIHSEYGMTELLSQAYSQGGGVFLTPPWLRVFIRDPYDPFALLPEGRTGGINIVDLANIYSCAFLETQDLGRRLPDGAFTVEGRFDHSEMRGCNLMVQEV